MRPKEDAESNEQVGMIEKGMCCNIGAHVYQ